MYLKTVSPAMQVMLLIPTAVILSLCVVMAALQLWFPYSLGEAVPLAYARQSLLLLGIAVPGFVAPIVAVRFFQLMSQVDALREDFARLAVTDQLSQLFNRRGFEDSAVNKLYNAAAECRPTALLLCDIDHFKSINDSFGHEFGDKAIQHIASCLNRIAKNLGGIAGRYGGEEFVMLLPGFDAEQARAVGEGLRLTCAEKPVDWKGDSTKITISIGIGFAHSGCTDLSCLLNHADTALYKAKNCGRNRVVVGLSDVTEQAD